MFTTAFQAWVRGIAMRAMARLNPTNQDSRGPRKRNLPITPNQITVAGLAITLLAAGLVALGHPFYGGLTLLFAGLFDILDGALARATNRSYTYGAFLDSTTDRYAEIAMMLAISVYLQRRGVAVGPTLALVALGGSLMVSYTKARAQSLGFRCDGGVLARPERVILTVVGLLLVPANVGGLLAVLWILAVFTNFTAVQRIWSVWRQARARMAAETMLAAGVEPEAANGAPPAAAEAVARDVAAGGAAARGTQAPRGERAGAEPAGG